MILTIVGFSSNFHSKSSEARWNLLLNPTFSVFGKIAECHSPVAPCLVLGCMGRELQTAEETPGRY